MSSGRPRKFDPDTALEAAMQAFWTDGYAACSLQTLLEVTGLSRSSLYQFFGGKLSLFERCLDRYQAQSAGRMLERLEVAESGRTFIRDLLASVADESRSPEPPRGCFIMNTASEFGQGSPVVARAVGRGLQRFRRVFAMAVRLAQQQGEISQNRDPESLAIYLVANMSGLRTMVKAGSDAATVDRTVSIVLRALD